MKHIFVVETADDRMLSPKDIDTLTEDVQDMVELRSGYVAFATSICNQKSAIRGVYQMYGAEQFKSPDELGAAK